MLPDPQLFAHILTAETGLALAARRIGHGSNEEIELVPAGHQASQTFKLRARLGWRSVEVNFEPGAYAGDLVAAMQAASPEARRICESVIAASVSDGAEIQMTIDGVTYNSVDEALWRSGWRSLGAQLSRGQLDVNSGNTQTDTAQLVKWTGRLAAAMFALMPLQAEEETSVEELQGYPEGAKITKTVNRYERDRRNRAAALAIHGYRCKACDRLMLEEYGDLAATLIEVHHVTPVHALGAGYIIDPQTDLVPLCPNCHSVAHTRTPPLTVDQIRVLRGNRSPNSEHVAQGDNKRQTVKN